MNRVVIDEDIQAKVCIADAVELYDRAGRKVGNFLSEQLYRRLLFDWANAQISDEELERRRRQPGGESLAEIWARLQKS